MGQALAFPDQTEAFNEGEPITGTVFLVGALDLRVICSLALGLVNAALAKSRSRGAVLTMAVLLLLTGIAIQPEVWSLVPLWYHSIFLALLVPVCLLGGRRGRDQ